MSRKFGCAASLTLMTAVAGCTAIAVRPVEQAPEMTHVCIHENVRVQVTDFLPVLQEGLSRHGFSSETFVGRKPPHCEFTMTYTARRSWDMAPYLSQAEIWIWRDRAEIGHAEYRLRGKGGYSMYKWQGTKVKMDPVIDQLLVGR